MTPEKYKWLEEIKHTTTLPRADAEQVDWLIAELESAWGEIDELQRTCFDGCCNKVDKLREAVEEVRAEAKAEIETWRGDKNYWRERALKAEPKVEKLRVVLERLRVFTDNECKCGPVYRTVIEALADTEEK